MMRYLLRHLKDEEGSVIVEFALMGTFVAFSLITLIDIATAVNTSSKLGGGLRAGSQYAVRYPNDSSGIAQTVASASGLESDALSVTSSQFCEWAGVAGPCNMGTGAFAKYVTVSLAYSMSGKYVYTSPFYPSSLAKSVTMRIQ